MGLIYLEDYEVGLVHSSAPRLVSQEEIIGFASEWDPQPFHVNEELAKKSIYGGITACTAHIFAICGKLGSQMEEKVAAMAGLGFDEMRVHQPLRAGDSVYFESECLEVRRSKTKSDRGIIKNHTKLFNQRDELVYSFHCTMMVASNNQA